MRKYKLWVAVDESGDFYVFLGERPTFDPNFGEWRNDRYHSGSDYIHAGHDTELKAGAEAIKEIEVELPTKGEEFEHLGIKKVAKTKSHELCGYEESDYTIPFCHGAEWAKEKCNQIIRRVLEHYEHGGDIDSIMADYEEMVSIQMD